MKAPLTFDAVATNVKLFRGGNSIALAGKSGPIQKVFLSPVTRPWKDDIQSGNILF